MYVSFVKPILDFLFATILLVTLTPVFLMVIVLLLFSKQKVFFIQTRPGKKERLFKIYKFCTMNEAKDNEGNLATDDKRITPVGYWLRKSSIDELPQLINVLKGEMSLIGPRPLLIEYLPLYNEKHKKRHKVLPGLTGWAQVNGRNEATWPERLDKDVYYAENVSFALDCLIFFKTFWLVLTGKGVSETGKATMTPFRGYSE